MKRSKFNLSYSKLLTCDMGELIPCGLTEVLPGDSIMGSTSVLLRCSPLMAPVMHPVTVRVHHFFVPNRLIWDNWEDFITGGPTNSNASIPPWRGGAFSSPGNLGDYFGIPPGTAAGTQYSALPWRAYGEIFNEYFRDQDLTTPVAVSKADGPDTTTVSTVQKVAWEKDYFTTCRPWTQKGPDVSVPMGTTAPVITAGAGALGQPRFTGAGNPDSTLNTTTASANVTWDATGTAVGPVNWLVTGLLADLQNATAANINELRMAFALQRYAEFRARFGSRYVEYLRGLGITPSDARLQRPEYLGGGRQVVQFSEVLQTSPTGAGPAGVGEMFGHGLAAMRSNRFLRFFEEHGWLMTLLSVKPKTMYGQAAARHWFRKTKEDYFQRELQHVGQQEVFNKEVMATHTVPEGVFGYQDRYDEYRRSESSIAADFRTTMADWHYARLFAADVALNDSFVKCDATKRPNQVQTEDVLWLMVNHNIRARRLVAGAGTSFIH